MVYEAVYAVFTDHAKECGLLEDCSQDDRERVNSCCPTYLYRGDFNGSFVVQQLGSSACLYLTFRQRMAVPLHRATTPVWATSARAVTTPAFGTSPTTPLLQQKYLQPTTTSTTTRRLPVATQRELSKTTMAERRITI